MQQSSAPPNREAIAEEFFSLIPQLLHQFRPKPSDHPEGSGPEVRGQFRVLGTLARRGPMTMRELSESMFVTPPTATGIVKRLGALGAVQRRSDPRDKRTTWVELSEEGLARLQAFEIRGRKRVAQRFEELSDEDLAAIAAALPALRRLSSRGYCHAETTEEQQA